MTSSTTSDTPPSQQQSQPQSQPQSQSQSPTRDYYISSICLIFIVPAIGGALFGYDIGATSYVISQLSSSSSTTIIQNNASLTGIIVSSSSFGALIGSWFIYQINDIISRRKELQIGSILYMIGTVLEFYSSTFTSTCTTTNSSSLSSNASSVLFITILIIGRLIYGIGIGITMHGAPTYLAEMGPSTIRGLLVSLKEASIVLGILLGYVVGYIFSNFDNAHDSWKYTYGCSIILSTTMFGFTLIIPRSYRWLLLHHMDEEEALQSIRFVFCNERVVQQEFVTTKETIHNDEQYTTETTTVTTTAAPYYYHGVNNNNSSSSSSNNDQENSTDDNIEDDEHGVGTGERKVTTVWDKCHRSPMIAAVGLVVLQQITGQPSVLSYATPIFKRAGLSNYASVVVASFKLIATLCAAFTVEKFGRKKLLYIGCTLMLIALSVLTISFGDIAAVREGGGSTTTNTATTTTTTTTITETAVMISMLVYIAGYQCGFGPVTWLIISEVFPGQVRGQAVAFSVQMNFFLNAVVQFGVPVLQKWIGLNATFAIFGILTAYSIYFVRVHVIETKGLTLEEIEQKFKEKDAAQTVGMPILQESALGGEEEMSSLLSP